jgi:predicted  nucleic acid-binding Zn-ribbon protein
MIKFHALILCALFTSTTLAANLMVESPSMASFSAASQPTLATLPNTLEPRWLDQFIRTYPNAKETAVAFTLRYRIAQGINTSQAYQSFIDAYPRTLAAMEAQYTLLQLYRPENEPDRKKRLVGYLDFMYRYPNTSLALVAKASAEQAAFEEVRQTNQVEEYDNFMQLFPNAPQISEAEKLARKKAVENEQARINAEISTLEQRKAQFEPHQQPVESTNIETQASITIAIGALNDQIKWAKEERATELCTEFEKLAIDIKAPDRQQLRTWERLAHVIQTVYPEQSPAGCVRAEQRHQELLAKLEQIRQTIKAENTRLIEALQAEFVETRKVITQGFAQLHHDNQMVQQSLNALLDGVAQLHQDLGQVNVNLKQLHTDLGQIQTQLVKLNHDMNQGMKAQQDSLKKIAGHLETGFDRLSRNINAGTKAIVNSQQQIRQAIHTQTDVIYKTTDLMLNESRQTREEISDLGQKMVQHIAKASTGDCGSFCKISTGSVEMVSDLVQGSVNVAVEAGKGIVGIAKTAIDGVVAVGKSIFGWII